MILVDALAQCSSSASLCTGTRRRRTNVSDHQHHMGAAGRALHRMVDMCMHNFQSDRQEHDGAQLP